MKHIENPNFRVIGSNDFKVTSKTLYELYKMYKEGQIKFASPWLQRQIQQEAWTKTNRPASYLQSMLQGNAKVDTFAFADLDVILKALQKRKNNTTDKVLKSCYDKLIEEVLFHQKKGALVYCIDGQNRLDLVITPFFDNYLKVSPEFTVNIMYDIGGPVPLDDLTFKEMPPIVQEHIKKESVPTVWAREGDLSAIIRTLVNKNSGVAWSEWEKLCSSNFFTVHYQQNVMDVLYYKDRKTSVENEA